MSFIDKELFEEAEDLSAILRKKRSCLNEDEKNYFDDYEDSEDYMNESFGHPKYIEEKAVEADATDVEKTIKWYKKFVSDSRSKADNIKEVENRIKVLKESRDRMQRIVDNESSKSKARLYYTLKTLIPFNAIWRLIKLQDVYAIKSYGLGIAGRVGGSLIGLPVIGDALEMYFRYDNYENMIRSCIKDTDESINYLEDKLKELKKGSSKRESYEYVNVESFTNKRNINLESMTMAQKYDSIIREYFDITDSETRQILVGVSESDKNQVLSSLTNKLYQDIVDKVDDIDFGTIPRSAGDITKIENYDKLIQCLETLDNIMKENKQDTKNNIQVIREAIYNVQSRKELFQKSFQLNLELPMVLYSTIVLSIVSSVSFMISSCIEFIKSPNQDTFDVEIDKVALNRTKDNVLFSNLAKFNDACKKGQIDSTINYIIKNRIKNFTGYEIGIIIGGISLIGIILNIIPIMRELIFFFYYSRVRISDYFEIQAELLQMNAYNIDSNTAIDKEEKKKIVKKQMKIVDFFRKISNTIGIDNKSAEVKATKDLTKSSKEKYKYKEVSDTLPDSVASEIF